jgi:hypothetical protein
MILVVILAVFVVAFLLMRSRAGLDGPGRIVNAATARLPERLGDWGQAMVAELAQLHGTARRWRFAAGVLRVALFPPVVHPGRVLGVGGAGLILAAGATTGAARAVPSMAVFVAVLGFLLCAYATVAAARFQRSGWTASRLIVGVVALAAIAGAIAATTAIAVAHPAAAADGSHLFSVAFALILTGYLAYALSRHTTAVLWWGLCGALASGTVWAASALVKPLTSIGVLGLLSPVGVVATLAVSIGASILTRDRATGVRAGMLSATLGALMLFAINLFQLVSLHDYTLTDPYDIAAFPKSGLPDAASYLLSDALGGEIISGLILYPLALLAVALIGSLAGAGIAGRSGVPAVAGPQ